MTQTTFDAELFFQQNSLLEKRIEIGGVPVIIREPSAGCAMKLKRAALAGMPEDSILALTIQQCTFLESGAPMFTEDQVDKVRLLQKGIIEDVMVAIDELSQPVGIDAEDDDEDVKKK